MQHQKFAGKKIKCLRLYSKFVGPPFLAAEKLFLLGKHDFKLMINLSIPVMKNKMILKFTYFKPTKIYVFGKLIKFCT